MSVLPVRERTRVASGGDVLTAGVRAAIRAVARAARAVWWYATNLMGESAYATYVEHHRRTHPGEAPLNEREFWRKHYADQDANPGARCC